MERSLRSHEQKRVVAKEGSSCVSGEDAWGHGVRMISAQQNFFFLFF
jgi:hypothetical protein